MEQILLVFHIIFAVVLIGLVLIQKGKGADMGVAFGSGASSTVFGSKGSGGFLMKFTVGIAALFFGTSIALTYVAARQARHSKTHSVLSGVEQLSHRIKEQANTKVIVPAKKSSQKILQDLKKK